MNDHITYLNQLLLTPTITIAQGALTGDDDD